MMMMMKFRQKNGNDPFLKVVLYSFYYSFAIKTVCERYSVFFNMAATY